jgi:hypothetical protein
VVFGIDRGYGMKSWLETSTNIDYIVSVMIRELVASFVAERRASGRRNLGEQNSCRRATGCLKS